MTAEAVIAGGDNNDRASISAAEAGVQLYSGWEIIRIGLQQNDYALVRLGIKKTVIGAHWPVPVVISQILKMIEKGDV